MGLDSNHLIIIDFEIFPKTIDIYIFVLNPWLPNARSKPITIFVSLNTTITSNFNT